MPGWFSFHSGSGHFFRDTQSWRSKGLLFSRRMGRHFDQPTFSSLFRLSHPNHPCSLPLARAIRRPEDASLRLIKNFPFHFFFRWIPQKERVTFILFFLPSLKCFVLAVLSAPFSLQGPPDSYFHDIRIFILSSDVPFDQNR